MDWPVAPAPEPLCHCGGLDEERVVLESPLGDERARAQARYGARDGDGRAVGAQVRGEAGGEAGLGGVRIRAQRREGRPGQHELQLEPAISATRAANLRLNVFELKVILSLGMKQ